ncbi:MAG: metal-dependent transcriptional regulator [Deltaproteobacteria bacterium]|nr:metal-dependent transcriptional regulator [Deltaproteobacteria bacterium]
MTSNPDRLNGTPEQHQGHRWYGGREVRTREESIDELLELIWILREKGVTDLNSLLQNTTDPEARAVLNQMMGQGLFEMEGDILKFKEKGESLAEGIVRRHRLTERLLMELFEMSEEEAEEEACKLEHVLSPAVTDSVCSFLGHPPVCPHGKPIPQGPCCKKLTGEMKPLIRPLNDLALGQEGRVVFISTRVKDRLEPLSSFGVIPGIIIQLKQRRPSYVIQIGETSIALDESIGREIFVKAV